MPVLLHVIRKAALIINSKKINYLFEMKKLYFLITIFTVLLYACNKEKELELSDVPDSLRQHMKEGCTCDPRIGLFKWNERVLYVHWYIGPTCNTISTYYNEEGGKVDLTAEEQHLFWEHKELVKMIWVCGE